MTSLVTRCPACSTLFKVVPDQLRISDGWVRCGQCDEVFDAHVHMQAPMRLQEEALGPTTGSAPAPDLQASVTNPEVGEPVSSQLLRAPSGLVVDEIALSEAETTGAADVSVADVEPDVPQEPGLSGANGTWGAMDLPDELQPLDPAPSPSFMQAAGAQAPKQFVPRWVAVLCGVGLAIALAAQWMLHERDRLAAMQPQLKPFMEQACGFLGCSVQPLRRIESVVIESSSFVKVKADVYRLGFGVRNTAPWPLAVPSAELTLTDAQDQSVFRRVLSPSELSVSAATLAAGEELAVTVPIAVKVPAVVSERVSGYRLLVFYP